MRIGPYEILGELGRGGMGVVYRARHPQLPRDVALKVIVPGADTTPAALARLQREAQAAARLAGVPGIVGVHDIGEIDGQVWFAMELIEGQGLDRIAAENPMAPHAAAALMLEVAQAVQRAHDAGVLHRDLKPGNILLDASGHPHVTDFGLAKLTAANPDITRVTRSGELLGTPAYMAPEQARGTPCDGRADVYALGATLYEVVSGAPPFRADSVHGVLSQVLTRPAPPMRLTTMGVPAALDAIVLKCLEKSPRDRYPTPGAFADDLNRFVQGERVHARLPGLGHRLQRWVRAHRVVTAGIGVALVAGATFAALWWHGRARGDDAATGIEQATAERAASERAQQLAAAWTACVGGSDRAMRRLSGRRFGVALTDAELAAARESCAAAARAARAACPESALADAWEALAEHHAGDAEAGLERLRAAAAASVAADDPFPRVLLGWTALLDYVGAIHLPTATLGTGRVRVDPYDETERMQAALEEVRSALGGVPELAIWSALDQGSELLDVVQGALAFAEHRYGDAVAHLDRAVDVPLLTDGAHVLRGLARFQQGAFAEAAADWEAGAAAGWLVLRHFVGVGWMSAGIAAMGSASDPLPLFGRARAAFDGVVSMYPQRASALCHRGHVLLMTARAEGLAKRDPVPTYEQAILDYRAALAVGREDLATVLALATALADRASAIAARGGDPEPGFTEATTVLTRAAELAPTDPGVFHKRGLVEFQRGEWLRGQGRDASAAFTASMQAYTAVLAVRPNDADALQNRAVAGWRLGVDAVERGHDGTPMLTAAAADAAAWSAAAPSLAATVRRAEILLALGNAVHKSGVNAWPHYAAARELFDALPAATRARAPLQHLLGKILVEGAGAALRAKQDPEPLLTAGTEALTRAAQQTPNVLGIWETLGSGWRQLANVAASRGGDARAATVEALTAFDRALALSPANPALLSSRATVHHEAALRDTGDGEAHFTAALEDLDRAIAAQDGRYALHVNRALVLRDRATRRVKARNDDGLADYDEAVRSLATAIEIDPAPWKAWFDRASIRVSVGKLVKASSKDPSKWYRAALADFDQALQRAPRNLDVAHNRANVRRLLAEHLGPEGRPLLEQAEGEFRAVVQRAPRAWQALAGWAMTLEGLGRPAEARQAWERVLQVKPDLAAARERLAALSGQ